MGAPNQPGGVGNKTQHVGGAWQEGDNPHTPAVEIWKGGRVLLLLKCVGVDGMTTYAAWGATVVMVDGDGRKVMLMEDLGVMEIL